ncbi:carbohydrate diacid regulator [Peribacillus cavernae]|uniref:Carbohydrate diacid regulator n=1 Tax=Peribacillus cavernae TaxID=1674310 RepID=A0A3S0VIV8_9BACI|nr:sugar diacid recognition domain-containing protein [Peribacillus cavernae]MDQ0220373.1 carbohydrate diacid regulator [Peribacillus cavernae]RUQ25538.1 carbohydrate diacid regulator [Peribacillus cavernae]
MILPELAEKIIEEVKKLMDEDIIVVNTEGTIIASTDQNRIGTFHEGALIASKQAEKLTITEEDQKHLSGVKAGINLPVFFQKEVIGVIGITGDPEKVSPFGEILRKMTELFIRENYFSEQLDLQSRALEAFVFDWVQSGEWKPAFYDRAQLLHVDLSVHRQVVIAELNQQQPVHRDIWQSIFRWNNGGDNDIIIRWGNDRLVMLLETKEADNQGNIFRRISLFHQFLKSYLHIPIPIGVGQQVPPEQLQKSYKQAERALKAIKHEDRILFDEDLTIEMVLDDLRSETKSVFLERTIGPILAERELILTIRELFQQNHSLTRTSKALHIHINTLHYRLKKIDELTGLNPGNILDLLTIYLGLIILDDHTKN